MLNYFYQNSYELNKNKLRVYNNICQLSSVIRDFVVRILRILSFPSFADMTHDVKQKFVSLPGHINNFLRTNFRSHKKDIHEINDCYLFIIHFVHRILLTFLNNSAVIFFFKDF